MNLRYLVRRTDTSISCVCLLICSLLTFGLSAQVSQPHRYERLHKNSDDNFHVISLKEDGIALFRERDKYKNNNKLYELILLDTTLQEKKSVELEVKERYRLVGYEVTSTQLYFLFRYGESTKGEFECVEVTLSNGNVAKFNIKPDFEFRLSHFSQVDRSLILGGYINNEPAILLFDVSSALLKVVPGFFQKDTELVDLRVNQNSTFNTVTIDRGTRGDRKLTFKTFDSNGKILIEDVVPIDENISVQNGLTSTLENEDLLVFGNWGEKNSKQSKGFYSLKIDPFNDQKIKYVDFGQFQHFLEYLNPKRVARLKEISKEDKSDGKIPSFSAYVMPYRLVEKPEGYLLLAEVYTPNSNINPYYTGPYYYSPYYYGPAMGYGPYFRSRPYAPGPNDNRTNTSIRTNQSAVISFNNSGEVRWDQSYKLEDIDLPSTEQASDFLVTKNSVFLVYKKEFDIKVKAIDLPDDNTEEITEKIKPSENGDEIRDEEENEGGVRFWYGNNLYVWGLQTIRNLSKEDRVRDVFYINKVTVK
ncbi:hypothetical protein [Pseudochryseolinea flava]|uniref:Uncharacterized protein n=1 Tax=Pseudochryseolinea flava TaxID=2059302 RepID=A0A364XZJ4_9BACT|nr:hypothetical protein [Pseudochryseolinea flava]RAV99804.1 hypothetical protein DQQ10_17320 [Pseudochryseolinea flava]